MLTLFPSPIPSVLQAGPGLPQELARLLERMRERPENFAWIVPTGRRKRALVHDWLAFTGSKSVWPSVESEPRPSGRGGNSPVAHAPGSDRIPNSDNDSRRAAILPRFFTLESFVAEVLEYGLRQKPRISGPERLLRLAAIWNDLTGRSAGPGVIHQIDRYVRDCQACGLGAELVRKLTPHPSPPRQGGREAWSKPGSGDPEVFDKIAAHYLSELESDGLLDRLSAVAALAQEISNPESWPNRIFLKRFEAILIDGFHRVEPVELELIRTLGSVHEVFLWLVGIPETESWKTVEAATDYLKKKGANVSPDRDFEDSAPATRFSEIGRRLFRQIQSGKDDLRLSAKPQSKLSNAGQESTGESKVGQSDRQEKPEGLFKLEVGNPLDEVEAVARQIKWDYLESKKTEHPMRLSDVAVIIAGPAYDPLIREVFPRAGLEFNLAGRALLVSTSRPARVLLAAIELIQGRWRYDLLRDFLHQPLVLGKLELAHRLDDLFEYRPRARQRMNHGVWTDAWNRQLERLKRNIESWRAGSLDLPERTTLSREEFVAKQEELAASLGRLLESIEMVLKSVDGIARAIEKPPNASPLSDLVQVVKEFLGRLEIDEWLEPPPLDDKPTDCRAWASGPVLWVEYEKDQNAYLKLLDILESLRDIPAGRLPKRDKGQPDVLSALELALDGETYQIKTEDDAGVQVFELREIRGLQFRHVYVLGLVNGQIPALPEEGILVRRRLAHPKLRAHLEQKEAEVQFLFSQAFEASHEKLVLSRPMHVDDQPELPSPFLTTLGDHFGKLPELKPPDLVPGIGQAACELGRTFQRWVARPEPEVKGVASGTTTPFEDSGRATQSDSGTTPSLSDLWPNISIESSEKLAPIMAGLTGWQKRPAAGDVGVDWPEMMQMLFPDDHQFSPSQLETYAACPFRFFGTNVMRLEEREADPTRLHYGSLVHRVLQSFYRRKRKEMGIPNHEPLGAIERSDRELLIKLFEEELDNLDKVELPPDLPNLFVKEGGVIDLFLEILGLIEGDEWNFGNTTTEYELPNILLGRDSTGRPVLLTGKIDRVDAKRSDPGTRIIIDYKTGSVPQKAAVQIKVSDGRMLQLPLYAAALEIQDKNQKVMGGAYVYLNEKPRSEMIRGPDAIVAIGEPVAGKSNSEVWNTQAAVRLALDLAGGIRAGRFHLTLHDSSSDHPECSDYCPLRHACRHPDGYKSKSNW